MSQEDAVRFVLDQGPPAGRSVQRQGDRVLDGHAHDLVTEMDNPRDAEGQTSELSYRRCSSQSAEW
jgi:hypothetical protein